MEKKLRLGLVWGQRTGAMEAQIATANFGEFLFCEYAWPLMNTKDIDDVGRVYGDVRVNGMVGPQVHPGVTRPQG